MKVVNTFYEVIVDYDETKGFFNEVPMLKEGAINKGTESNPFWDEDDYEIVLMYFPYKEEYLEPTQLDMIEAQVTYTAMMTDTLLEV